MEIEFTRTSRGIHPDPPMCESLDSLGDAAAKIRNVARWTAGRVWDAIGIIPDEGPRNSSLTFQAEWKDMNAESSQAVIDGLSSAFQSWFALRQKIPPIPHGEERSNDRVANPSVYQFDRESGTVRPMDHVVS